MSTKTKEILEDVKERLQEASDNRNIASSERLLSVAAGAFVLYTGITRMFKTPLTSLAEVTLGSALILRGATGYCPVKDSVCCPERELLSWSVLWKIKALFFGQPAFLPILVG